MPSKAKAPSQSIASDYPSKRQARSIKLHDLTLRLRLAGHKFPPTGQMNHELRLYRYMRLHQGVARTKDLFKELSGRNISSRDILNVLEGRQPPHENVFLHHCRWALAAEQYHDGQERSRQADFVKKELKRLKRPIQEVLKCSLLSQTIRDSLKAEVMAIESELESLRSFIAEDTRTIPHPFTVTPYDPRDGDENPLKRRHKGSDWSRHAFWTHVLVALYSIWKKAGQTDYRAFKDIARLLSLMFPPFPSEPDLLKRRFYHSHRSTN